MAESFGDLLLRFRVAASLTQEGLAERARMSPQTISALERGRRRAPRLSTVAEIADALGLDPAQREALANAATGLATSPEATEAPEPPESPDREVVSQQSQDGSRAKSRIPTPFTSLIGRHLEVEAIAHAVSSQRLLTLVGPGGVGKTRLALQVANVTAEKFDGGISWIDLGAVSDPDVVPRTVLVAVGGMEQPQRSIEEQILAALPERPVLLVVDNCEHMLDAVAELAVVLLQDPWVSILTTSREPIGVVGEVQWSVSPLGLPDADVPLTVDALGDVESVELFMDRASRADPTFRLTDENAEAVANVCRRLDGIPLAIELTAVRVKQAKPSQLADELDNAFALARTSARGVPVRHSSLWASVNWSYQLLNGDERVVLRCLAAFSGPFTLEAATWVAGRVVPSLEQHHAEEILLRLVNKSLVSVESNDLDPDGSKRYRLLDTIRTYAADQRAVGDEFRNIRDAHADYYLWWLGTLRTADPTDAVVDLVSYEYPNIRAAIVWSIEESSPRAARLVVAVGINWFLLSRFHDSMALGDGALGIVAGVDAALWTRAVGMLATARLVAGDLEFVVDEVQAAAEQAKTDGDALSEGWCRFVLANMPPNDIAGMAAAYELGTRASSPTLAAIAASNPALCGTDDDPDTWLIRIQELEGHAVGSTAVLGGGDIARLEIMIERGDLQGVLDHALPLASDTSIQPTVRSVWVDRLTQIALLRRDPALSETALSLVDDLARFLPERGFWGLDLQRLRLALARGEPPSLPDIDWVGRIGIQPASIRTLCKAALDLGERLDPVAIAEQRFSTPVGSLIVSSISAIHGAWALVDGDDQLASNSWCTALRNAASKKYLVLVCDALEALGCLAARTDDHERARILLSSASGLRSEITYEFRFEFERSELDDAWKALGDIRGSRRRSDRGGASGEPRLPWQDATELALSMSV